MRSTPRLTLLLRIRRIFDTSGAIVLEGEPSFKKIPRFFCLVTYCDLSFSGLKSFGAFVRRRTSYLEDGEMSQFDTMLRYNTDVPVTPFADRRQRSDNVGSNERRQFGNSYRDHSAPAKELAEAIDAYKVEHRRRYITAEELLSVIEKLGYHRG